MLSLKEAKYQIGNYNECNYRNKANGYKNPDIQMGFARLLVGIARKNSLLNDGRSVSLTCERCSGISLASVSAFLYPRLFDYDASHHCFLKSDILVDDYIGSGDTIKSILKSKNVDRIVVIKATGWGLKKVLEMPKVKTVHILQADNWLTGYTKENISDFA